MYTSKQCTSAPFIPQYYDQTGVTIFTGATELDNQNGNTYLIVFGQGLWFGKITRKSLINPNQCQAFGFIICDNPTDKYRSLGIETYDIFSFHMKRTTCGTITQDPTDKEIEYKPRV